MSSEIIADEVKFFTDFERAFNKLAVHDPSIRERAAIHRKMEVHAPLYAPATTNFHNGVQSLSWSVYELRDLMGLPSHHRLPVIMIFTFVTNSTGRTYLIQHMRYWMNAGEASRVLEIDDNRTITGRNG